MVVQTEKRLIWHPRLDNKFLVGGGSQVTLYEWLPDSSEIKHVTSKQDLNLMKVQQPPHPLRTLFTARTVCRLVARPGVRRSRRGGLG